MEQFPSPGAKETPRETTPQKKMEGLIAEYDSFSQEPYLSMDQTIVEGLKQNVLDSMEKLRKEYPELNN